MDEDFDIREERFANGGEKDFENALAKRTLRMPCAPCILAISADSRRL